MSSTQRSFADEARELEASLPRDRQVAVVRLRALHEAWARAILGLGPKEKLVPGVRVRVESGIAPDKAAERPYLRLGLRFLDTPLPDSLIPKGAEPLK